MPARASRTCGGRPSDDEPLSGALALQLDAVDVQARSQAAARPQGWDARTHGDRSAADYGLFDLDRVHDVHIVIPADDYRRMQDDLVEVVPMRGFMGRGRAGAAPPAGNQPNAGAPPGGGPFAGGWQLTTRDPEYVPVTVRHDGREWTRVGLRYKGNFSLMMSAIAASRKISFRLNFDRYEDTSPEVANQRSYGFKERTKHIEPATAYTFPTRSADSTPRTRSTHVCRAWQQLIAPTVAREAPTWTTVSSPQNFQKSIDALIASVDRRRSTIIAALGR
jgi:hypothetical protein